MKSIIFILKCSVCFLLIFGCQKKTFQGTILYDMDYIDKSGQMNENQVDKFIGKNQVYFFKNNKYKSVMNGMLQLTLIYTGKDTLYNTIKNSKNVKYINVSERNEKIVSSIIKKNQEIILGYECDVLELMTSDGKMEFYFNRNLKINKNFYKSHKKGFWDFLLEKTDGALPLKWITNTSGLKLIIKAKKIEHKVLKDSIFQLPKDLPLTR
ncbi:DUF4412 domain-containing protein [Tenacibaculum maritimum]|nr:DUF4412 domain-containing protein [Tenacibaculum maritimum]MDB0613527.1 DUF4412 domain-containing protein [Tenacibaculum maritimum]